MGCFHLYIVYAFPPYKLIILLSYTITYRQTNITCIQHANLLDNNHVASVCRIALYFPHQILYQKCEIIKP